MGKKIISYILSFILVICLLVSIVVCIFSNTILKEEYVLNTLAETDYYTSIYNEIMENFENNTIQSGLTDEVLSEIITMEMVEDDVNALISYLYGNTEKVEIDTSSISEKLQENILKEVEENNKTITDEEQEDINTYVETITKIYENGIEYSASYLNTIQNVIVKVVDLVNQVQIILYIVTIFFAILLIIINKSKSMQYIGTAFIATGVLLIIVKIIEMTRLQINNILLLNQAFSTLIISLVSNIIMIMLVTGIILFVAGVALSLASSKDE